MRTRRDILRRHRRERQFLVFGLLILLVGAFAAIGLAVYQGRIEPPIDEAIATAPADFEVDSNLPCPPASVTDGDGLDLPMAPEEVSLRVLNGTDKTGLARGTLDVLTGRGYVGVGATNWNLTYAESVRVQFGVDGLRQAYTVARNFPNVELKLDSRKGALVDIILGEKFETSDIRAQYAPELDPNVPLTASGRCVPLDLAQPVPAPAIIPADPLAPSETPSPTPTASTEPTA